MPEPPKITSLQLRLTAVNIIRDLKSIYTYKELSRILGIPESLLCRYASGSTVPSDPNSHLIIEKVTNGNLIREVLESLITIKNDGYVDTSRVYFFPNLLDLAINSVLSAKCKVPFNKIITVVQNGVPFASFVASVAKRPLIIVKKHKESVDFDYFEEPLMESNGVITSLYLRKDLIEKDDQLLFVDDVIRSGKTFSAVKRLVEKAKAKISGVLVITSLTDLSRDVGIPFCKLI